MNADQQHESGDKHEMNRMTGPLQTDRKEVTVLAPAAHPNEFPIFHSFQDTHEAGKSEHRHRDYLKHFAIISLILALFPCLTLAQAVRYDSATYTTSSQYPINSFVPLMAVPGATVTICQDSACMTRATTYTNATASTACSTFAQLTPATGGACTATTDAQGNFGAWLLPGSYYYQIALPGGAGGTTNGPYAINVGAASGCPSGITCDANYSTLALAVAAAGNGTLAITRHWNNTPTQAITCQLQFFGNGLIQPAVSATVTISGAVSAPPNQQIFDTATNPGAAIAFSANYATVISPGWWGALPGASDVSGAVTNAIQSAVSSIGAGGNITFPPGTYSFCNVTIRTTAPVTVSGYGATINPDCTSAFVFTVFGNYNNIFGFHFAGTGGTQYKGIEITNDATTQNSQHVTVRDVWMYNMYQGIWDYMNTSLAPSGATYRAQITNTTIENYYQQATWAGSFGISFDGPSPGNAGGNDSRIYGGGVANYQQNVIVRNSTGTKISHFYTQGATDGIHYDGGSDLQLDDVYSEYNTNAVTAVNSPYQLIVIGGTTANFTTLLNGMLHNSAQAIFVGGPDGSWAPNIEYLNAAIAGVRNSAGAVVVSGVNEVDLCANASLNASANCMALAANGTTDFVADLTSISNTRTFTLYRPAANIQMNAANMYWDGLNLTFGTAATSNVQFPRASGLGSAIHSNGGSAANYNGLWLASNETSSSTGGGVQANASLSSWAVNIGGYNGITYSGTADTFGIFRKPAGGAYTSFLKIDSGNNVTFSNGFSINSTGAAEVGSATFASLGGNGNGTQLYCSDCKNVQNDGATAGATCVGSGSGAIARRENNQWHCN
ncbi:MAG: hypothetical protein KGL39_20385 [Patescibacteria group bacterium]|nr:hypothetical protein [Patescibacteria group bacterium]